MGRSAPCTAGEVADGISVSRQAYFLALAHLDSDYWGYQQDTDFLAKITFVAGRRDLVPYATTQDMNFKAQG